LVPPKARAFVQQTDLRDFIHKTLFFVNLRMRPIK
jgi:hypothetical protein